MSYRNPALFHPPQYQPLPYQPLPYQPDGYRYPPFYPPPPYWVGKREEPNREPVEPPVKRGFDEDYRWESNNVNKQLLEASKEQNKLLKTVLDKLSKYMDKNSATTTEDWNYIQPFLKQDIHENIDKKELSYEYYGDDWFQT